MKDRIERVNYIKERIAASKNDPNGPTHSIKNWRGRHILYLKIIQVDVDYLMYRIENSRTEIQQLAYLRNHPDLPRNLFSDPESQLAQQAQEDILDQINKFAGQDFFVDLKARGQDEPAIITYDGYLVNGNRRTAALKSLSERYIDCIVLPDDTTQKDIYELEQELQISQDFKEPYHWLNELRNVRRGLEDKRYLYTEREMASRLRVTEKDVKQMRRMLDLVDAFLLWKGIPGQYDYAKLDDTQQAFIELEKATKKTDDSHKLQELTNGVFSLIDERPLEGRLYNWISYFIKNFDVVYQRVSSEPTVEKQQIKIKKAKDSSNDVVDELIETSSEEIKEVVFNNPGKAKELSKLIVEKVSDVKAEKKEQSDNEAVFNAVSNSLREITGLVIEQETTKLEGIENKLKQIISIANDLLTELKKVK